MALIHFPDPERAAVEGIVLIGGQPSAANLLSAYRLGIFPWPIDGWPLPWFCPEVRAILEFKDLHIPRSLQRERNRTRLRFTIDAAFVEVIKACADAKRAGEEGTWITSQMIRGYGELHEAGHAHSVEAWDDAELVGGIYGVDSGGAFAGESMFFARPNASKLALLFLIEHLRSKGLEWLDIQVMTPHMATFGAKEISRTAFLGRLDAALARNLKLFL